MTLTELPRRININDTVTWIETEADYPASASWVVTYHFTSPDSHFSSTHQASGDDHEITIDTTADAVEAGRYDYAKKVTDGTSTFTLEKGYIHVDPDLAADTAGVDRREYARKALAAIEAVMIGKASKDQSSYSLGGRALSRMSPAELNEWRGLLRAEVRDLDAKARRKSGGKSHRNVRLRLSNDA